MAMVAIQPRLVWGFQASGIRYWHPGGSQQKSSERVRAVGTSCSETYRALGYDLGHRFPVGALADLEDDSGPEDGHQESSELVQSEADSRNKTKYALGCIHDHGRRFTTGALADLEDDSGLKDGQQEPSEADSYNKTNCALGYIYNHSHKSSAGILADLEDDSGPKDGQQEPSEAGNYNKTSYTRSFIHGYGYGGFSEVQRVKFHKSHFEFGSCDIRRKEHHFAVKRLISPNIDSFNKERASLLSFQDSKIKHLIKLFVTFEIKRPAQNGKELSTFYLMFPWADGDLWHFWKNREALDQRIDRCVWMAEQCHDLAVALWHVHNEREQHLKRLYDVLENEHDLYGRYGDVKADNVLWFEMEDILVIADFGLGRLHTKISRSNQDPKTLEKPATYGALQFDTKGHKFLAVALADLEDDSKPNIEHVSQRKKILPAGSDSIGIEINTKERYSSCDNGRPALFGLGGIGKTRIALEYISWTEVNRPETSVSWIYTSIPDWLLRFMSSVAQDCQVTGCSDPKADAAQLVRKWLKRNDKPWLMANDKPWLLVNDKQRLMLNYKQWLMVNDKQWLMVLDNVDDPDILSPPLRVRRAGNHSLPDLGVASLVASGFLTKPTLALGGHDCEVRSVALSINGRYLVSGSEKITIKIWDITTSAFQQILEGYDDGVRLVTLPINSCFLMWGLVGTTAKMWDVAMGTLQHTHEGYNEKGAKPGSKDSRYGRTPLLWAAENGHEAVVKLLLDWVISVAFSTGGRYLASGSGDKKIKIWDMTTGSLQQTLKGRQGLVTSIAFSTDGSYLVSGSDNATIKIWDVAIGTLQRTLEGYNDWATSVTFSINGRCLASGSDDKEVKIWDMATGSLQQTLKGRQGPVTSITFSTDGRYLMSGSDGETINIWDVAVCALRQTLEGHYGGVRSATFSIDSRCSASGSEDTTIKLWGMTTPPPKQTLEAHNNGAKLVTFSPDGRFLVSGSENTTIRICGMRKGALGRILEGHGDDRSVTLLTDDRYLVSRSDGTTIKIWGMITGALQQTLEGHSDWVNSVGFSTGGLYLTSGLGDTTIRIWDMATNALQQILVDWVASSITLKWSPDYTQRIWSSTSNRRLGVALVHFTQFLRSCISELPLGSTKHEREYGKGPYSFLNRKGDLLESMPIQFDMSYQEEGFFDSWSVQDLADGEHTSSQGSTSMWLPSNPSGRNKEHSLGGRKRKLSSGGDNTRDGDDDKDPPRGAKKVITPGDSRVIRRLACPFYKRDPRKYFNRRSCSGPGWPTVHRVKEHIYRQHSLPISCPRCNEVFSSDMELKGHMRTSPPCEVKDGPPIEGINAEQEKRLRRRKWKTDQSEAEKWVEAYRILFPEDRTEAIPSPYYEAIDYEHNQVGDSAVPSDLRQYEAFVRREVPSRTLERLESRIESLPCSLDSSMKEWIADIFQDLVVQQVEDFKKSRLELQQQEGAIPERGNRTELPTPQNSGTLAHSHAPEASEASEARPYSPIADQAS